MDHTTADNKAGFKNSHLTRTFYFFLFLCLIIIFMQSSTFATPPSIAPRSPQERLEIEQLRYNRNDAFPQAEKKFIDNAQRECSGYGYSQDDLDLTVEQVQKTYPASLSLKIIDKNLLALCPAFVSKQITVLNFDESKNLLRKYFQETEFFKKINLSSDYWTIKPMFDQFAINCSPEDIRVFQKAYCSFSATEQSIFGETPSFSGLLKKDFIKECPSAQKNPFCGS